MNCNEFYWIKTSAITSKLGRMYLRMILYINYHTFMQESTEGWEGEQPLETFPAWYLNHIN